MKSTVLKISNAPVYCFQFIGPVSTRFSNQRKNPQGRYFPSMIQAMYLLIGTAAIRVTTIIKKGKDHIALESWFQIYPDGARPIGGAVKKFGLEPFRPDQSHEQINKK